MAATRLASATARSFPKGDTLYGAWRASRRSYVGYGSYRYTYESGRSGEICLAGFAIRGRELVVYLVAKSPEQQALLAKLGKHRMGKSCLYFKRLADLAAAVLERLIVSSIAKIERRYGTAGS